MHSILLTDEERKYLASLVKDRLDNGPDSKEFPVDDVSILLDKLKS